MSESSRRAAIVATVAALVGGRREAQAEGEVQASATEDGRKVCLKPSTPGECPEGYEWAEKDKVCGPAKPADGSPSRFGVALGHVWWCSHGHHPQFIFDLIRWPKRPNRCCREGWPPRPGGKSRGRCHGFPAHARC